MFGSLQSYKEAPGTYQARLSVGGKSVVQPFEIVQDPRSKITAEAFNEQQKLLAGLKTSVNEIHEGVNRLREVRKQVKDWMSRTKSLANAKALADSGKALVDKITTWEEQVVQTKQETFQDVINFPNKLGAQFIYLMNEIDASDPPLTKGMTVRFTELQSEWERQRNRMKQLLEQHVPAFNAMIQQNAVPAVVVPASASASK